MFGYSKWKLVFNYKEISKKFAILSPRLISKEIKEKIKSKQNKTTNKLDNQTTINNQFEYKWISIECSQIYQ